MKFNFPKKTIKEVVQPMLRDGYRDKAEQIAVDNECSIEDVCATLIEEGIDDYKREIKGKVVEKENVKEHISKRRGRPPTLKKPEPDKEVVKAKNMYYCQNLSCPNKGKMHFAEDIITHDGLKFCSPACRDQWEAK